MPQKLITIALEDIQTTRKNPRSDLEEDDALHGLAASLGDHPLNMVSPPSLEQAEDGTYHILAGERRIQAARLAGWTNISCLVRPALDPEQAHYLRLVENLHRKDLHPLDRAAALKIQWLFANASEMDLEQEARTILARDQTPQTTLEELSVLLSDHDFAPTHPAVTWDEVLDRLGVDLSPARRKKLMQILGVDSRVQKRARETEITEAALRSMGQLEPDQQARVMEEIEDDPEMAKRVRRISNAVRNHEYELEDAISEAKGYVEPLEQKHHYAPEEGDDILNDQTMDVVLAWLDSATQAQEASENLAALLAEVEELSTPWAEYVVEATSLLQEAVAPFQ